MLDSKERRKSSKIPRIQWFVVYHIGFFAVNHDTSAARTSPLKKLSPELCVRLIR
jgi:hypothetical protein